jgi:hypothetical protein
MQDVIEGVTRAMQVLVLLSKAFSQMYWINA